MAVKNGIFTCFRKLEEHERRMERFTELAKASSACRSEEGIKEHQYDGLKESVAAMLDPLPARDKLVVVSRFGLNGAKPLSFADVGKIGGISSEGARKIDARALEAIREANPNPLDDLA